MVDGVGDHEPVGRPGDGDAAFVVQPVVIRTDQDQVPQFGDAAVLPMNDVVGMWAAAGAATWDHRYGL